MATLPWWPDEMGYAGEEHLDAEYVRTYDRKAGTDASADIALLLELGMDEQSVVVDLGAGTGTFALAAAPHCGQVVAVDVSPAMLAALNANVERAGLTNVQAVRGGFLSYEHHGAPANVVYTRNALHHLPDFWKGIALRRIHAMLAPGGILRLHDLVYAFDPADAEATIEDWLANARERPEDGWTRAELEVHLRAEYSTFSWLHEPLLEHAGFEIVDAQYAPSRTYAAYTCVKQ